MRRQNSRPPASEGSPSARAAIALMSAPAAKNLSEPAITMQRTSGSASKPLEPGGDLLPHLRRERVAGLGPVELQQADVEVVDRGLDDPGQAQLSSNGSIALMPVAARPMISFWICEVPS